METDEPLTDDLAKPNETNTSNKSVTDNQTKPNETIIKDISLTDTNLKPEKMEDVGDEGPQFHCELSDKELVRKIALSLLEGLSTACVDMTTGDMFKSPGSVAADVRKEMLAYLTERSQSFVAESVILDGGTQEEKSDHPFDIISDYIDDFLALKRGLLSRVSGWLLSDMREDKIDDFLQEMELTSFWSLDRREAIGQSLLKNVDFRNEFHCNKKFKTEEELEQHRLQCGFRTVMCENEGCSATFSAAQMEEHDSSCPFKMLPCEQKCPEILMRREMDRHCITVCPMKLVNCPFYSIGCQATVPSCDIREHCSNDVRSHLIYALQYLHKDVSVEDLGPRVEQIEKASAGRLAGMQGVRTFTNAVKNITSQLGPFMIEQKRVDKVEDKKASESSEQPANREEDTKTSDSGEWSAVKEKDAKISDSGEHPTDIKKDKKISNSGENPADGGDAKMSDSGDCRAPEENEAKTLDSSEHPANNERDETSNSGEHPAEKVTDTMTSKSGDHSADKEKDVQTSHSGEHPADMAKDVKASGSGELSAQLRED